MEASSREIAGSPPDGFDLVGQLARFVSGPRPRILIVRGMPGSGKSTLLRAIARRLTGPVAFVAYRTTSAAGTLSSPAPEGALDLSLLLVDPDRPAVAGPLDPQDPGPVPLSFAPTGPPAADPVPPPLRLTVSRMVAAGGGCLVVDSWDRSTEESFLSESAAGAAQSGLLASSRLLRDQLGRTPLHLVVAMFGPADPEMQSLADGVIELTNEEVDGATIRRIDLPKLRGTSLPDSHFLFSLAGGELYTPTAHAGGQVGGPGAPEPEPTAEVGSIWPGSTAYAGAFGRLRHNALTAVELDEAIPHAVMDALAVPAASAVIRAGGRVVWVPPGSFPPGHVVGLLGRHLPREALLQGLRVLSANRADASLGDLRPAVLPVVRSAGPPADRAAPSGDEAGVPLFPEAFRFLRDRRSDGPALFVLSLEGLAALSAVSGLVYDPATFPMIVSSYARLGRFHGLGFGRSDHPLTRALLPSVATDLRVHQRYGRFLVVGARPRTVPFLIDWDQPEGRYRLVPMQ
jgi:hypothetical protein